MLSNLEIYTDGSCIPNPGYGGWAFVAYHPKDPLSKPLYQKTGHSAGEMTTNNEMEQTALYEALSYLSKVSAKQHVALHIDSTYVLNGASTWLLNWKKKNWKTASNTPVANKELWIKIDELLQLLKSKQTTIEWKHVKAHNGHPKNELVDKLAKEQSNLSRQMASSSSSSSSNSSFQTTKRKRNDNDEKEENECIESQKHQKQKQIKIEENSSTAATTTTTTTTTMEEQQYIDLIKQLITNTHENVDVAPAHLERTGTGTLRCFGHMMRFSLADSTFPLLTCRKLPFKTIVEELLWMIRGDTDVQHLRDRNVHIWDNDTSRETLDKRGFAHYPEYIAGPIYGWQWRHFGAPYDPQKVLSKRNESLKTVITASDEGGIDQLSRLLEKLQKQPFDRRHLVTAWNVADLDKMALPPCHYDFQCFVSHPSSSSKQNAGSKLRLSLMLHLRSSDVAIGLPFNVASYALLTFMIAHVCNMEPHELIITTGDTHIYMTHVEQMKELVKQPLHPFPKLHISKASSQKKNLDDFSVDDFQLENYVSNSVVKLNMTF